MNKQEKLKKVLSQYNRVAIAFSGGVDSTFLLWFAVHTLGSDHVLAFTATSPSFPADESAWAKRIAHELGVVHRLIPTNELDDPIFNANPPDRCYHCKKHIFENMKRMAKEYDITTLLFGANLDDQNDYRPGHRAAIECGIIAPLVECCYTKADIRAESQTAGLPTWNKPAAPCLATRIPYNESITKEKLVAIEHAEHFLHEQGFPIVRVRHHGRMARIELPNDDLERLFAQRATIDQYLKTLGFTWVSLDLSPFQSGGLKVVLNEKDVT